MNKTKTPRTLVDVTFSNTKSTCMLLEIYSLVSTGPASGLKRITMRSSQEDENGIMGEFITNRIEVLCSQGEAIARQECRVEDISKQWDARVLGGKLHGLDLRVDYETK